MIKYTVIRMILLLAASGMIACREKPQSPGSPNAANLQLPNTSGAGTQTGNEPDALVTDQGVDIIFPEGPTIEDRFGTPAGFERVSVADASFAFYLRRLPLKPHNVEVRYYDGRIKTNQGIYEAVVDLDIGKRDLHQCADAIMRLRAEYLWHQGRYDNIHFNFTNGFRVDYTRWMEGNRILVDGNTTRWVNRTGPSNSYADFWAYMEMIFTYAGTLSLSKELIPVTVEEMKIGDVFIRGGTPGHAVIVVDMAEHKTDGTRLFMLAQSYMPAQEIQILSNRFDETISPWYPADFGSMLTTPEWSFERSELKRFAE